MGFSPEEPFYPPLAIPEGLDLTPEQHNGSILGAAFRRENPIVSAAVDFDFNPAKPFDPDYSPWLDIQGTSYEGYADRFVGARDKEDVARMKLQLDRENEDAAVLHAAGWKGTLASMAAGLLSPTTFLPGGVLVKGAKGVSIAKTGLSVSLSAGVAASIDEAFLHASQKTRTGAESAFAIGGSVILGGILGGAVGKMGHAEFKAAAKAAEEALVTQHEFDGVFRSLSAGSALDRDLELRGEFAFQAFNKIPYLRAVVRTDPILRSQLSPLQATRAGLVDLVETPLEYKINAEGKSVRDIDGSVEARIRDRERNDMVQMISHLQRSFAEYTKDGPVGFVGTITAPVTARFQHLLGRTSKMTSDQFLEEVGRAMRLGDKHPIPQVQSAADALRRNIFDKIKDEAIELGVFDDGMKIDNALSYFTRVYNTEKISQELPEFTELLKAEFSRRRADAQRLLAQSDDLSRKEIDVLTLRENISQNKKVLKLATDKTRAKRERARSAVGREGAVSRAAGWLRKAFQNRADALSEGAIDVETRAALKEDIADARGFKRLEPPDLLTAIRAKGGIKDIRTGGRWAGKSGWTKDAPPTELELLLGDSARTIRRNDGMEIDYMREALVEDGYLPEGGTIDDLMQAIGRAATGEKIYSALDEVEVARFEAAKMLREELDSLGIDVNEPLDRIIRKMHGANNTKVQKAKAGEADRSAGKAGKVEEAANAKALDAMDRLDAAKARLKEIEDEVGPKIRAEIKAALKELDKVKSEIRTLKAAQEKETFYANASDAEIDTAVRETIQSILGMKPGEHHALTALASPTRARVLDVADELLEPWLESNAEVVAAHYFRSMVPQLEMIRKFGDVNGTRVIEAINDEAAARMQKAKSAKERVNIRAESERNVRDFEAMRDRILGTYGVPANPKDVWVKGGRGLRNVSYMGFLGGMTLAAIPDVAGVIGHGGIRGAFGAGGTVLTDPKRMFSAVTDMKDFGAAAEWFLNSRAHSISDVFDQYGRGSKMERLMGEGTRHFGIVTGMIPWNVAWKSIGGAVVASRMAKAADAVTKGTASKKQLRFLAANGLEPWMAERIAKQIEAFGDKNGQIWMPRGAAWDDRDAFEAFRRAMNREFDLMVITPGQDKPLSFSTETGKFFFQFKSFGFSAYHRILLAGLQRADADTLAQFTTAVLLGGLVSNIKADLGGYERKQGTAFWEDALDRSGLAGWLFEPYGIAANTLGFSLSGEAPSRFQARASAQGLAGPSVDMLNGIVDATAAMARGQQSYRDIRKLMRPLPGNNHPLLNGTHMLALYSKIEEALVSATGAKPRP